MNELAILNQKVGIEGEPSQYLTFMVNNEQMAVAILDVKEIIEVGAMTRVPMTRKFIRGVINLRGNVVPVIDLSSRLGGPLSKLTRRSCIVLVEISFEDERHTMGLLVDAINEILEIPEQDTQKTPKFGTFIRADFIQSMGRIGKQFIVLLNVDSVLSVEELSIQSSILSAGAEKSTGVPVVQGG